MTCNWSVFKYCCPMALRQKYIFYPSSHNRIDLSPVKKIINLPLPVVPWLLNQESADLKSGQPTIQKDSCLSKLAKVIKLVIDFTYTVTELSTAPSARAEQASIHYHAAPAPAPKVASAVTVLPIKKFNSSRTVGFLAEFGF